MLEAYFFNVTKRLFKNNGEILLYGSLYQKQQEMEI